MSEFYTTRTTCRVCGYSDLIDLFSLGMHYINAFPQKVDSTLPQAPIDLVLCNHCTAVQLRHTARQELLYSGEYFYRSGTSATMRRQLRDLATDIQNFIELNRGDVVLSIGANDGTELQSFDAPGIHKVGVEPASNLAALCREHCDTFIGDFWGYDAYWQSVGRKAKVITAIGMMYDLDDINEFVGDISKSLDFDGVFVAQLMCLRNMIECNDVGNLAHEHVLFFSIKSLHYLYNQYGLEIFDIETNDVNGESYRIWARHIGSNVKARSGALRRMATVEWRDRGMDDPLTHKAFHSTMQENKDAVCEFVFRENRSGRRVWIRGASTKGNTILQFFSDCEFEGASDVAEWKHGRYMVGSWIPIHSPDYARERADTFVILPFAFKREIIEQEREWFCRGDKRFMVPLPSMEVIG